jgi:hypothetical protein
LFHDRHPPGELPVSLFSANLRDLEARRPGPVGVRLIGYMVGEDRSITCVLRARSKKAVRQYHAEQGVPCGRVECGRPTLQQGRP